MRTSLLEALGHPSLARAVPEAVAGADGVISRPSVEARTPDAYGLDSSADADIGLVEIDHIELVQERLDEEPALMMAQARQLWDADISESQVREALQQARAVLRGEGAAERMLESVAAFESTVGMPGSFHFEGYDPERLPIFPMDQKFETHADIPGWAFAFVAANTAVLTKRKAPFRHHGIGKSFVYDMPPARTSVALLGDFGNGLPHARYIAKHIRALSPQHMLYLGDVYYAGTSSEFASFVAPEIEGMLARTNVMMLTSNHEMYSKAIPYFSYLDHRLRKGAPQVQQGSYFCLRFGDAFQLIGVDTDYFGHTRFGDPVQRSWLGEVLRHGRERGSMNVLVTANEPFEYGKRRTTKLLPDLAPFLPSVDAWFWGNTHYCGLFDTTATLPISSCVGHGGYPYKLSEYALDVNPYGAPCPAVPLFLETQRRYRGTNLRPDLGNNGFVMMRLEPGQGSSQHRIHLEYMDWMKKPRYRAELGRKDGRVVVLRGEEIQ